MRAYVEFAVKKFEDKMAYKGNVSVFEVLWEWMREIEGKEEDLRG